ncbi:MAG: hypothetical protein SNH05_06625 [Rikenellaceae bacterium]
MGKVTVKYYLNKRLSPTDFRGDGRLFYPLYIQITVNRKTTQIKSSLDYLMTEKGFDLFSNGIDNDDEQKFGRKEFISTVDECATIQNCIQYVESICNEKYDLGSRNIRDDIAVLIKPAKEYLSRGSINARSKKLKDTDSDSEKVRLQISNVQFLLNMIDPYTPLWEIKNTILRAFDIDITKYFNPHYLAYWDLLDELRQSTDLEKKFITWFAEDYKQLDKHPKISIINELIQLSNWSIK